MTTNSPVLNLVGEYSDCLAYVEANNIPSGGWEYIGSAERLSELPKNSDIVIVATDELYWSFRGYWHSDDFMRVFWERDIWYRHISLVSA